MYSYEKFAELCEQRDIKPTRAASEAGVASSTIANWKKGKYTPKNEKLQKLADYFGVPLSYFSSGPVVYFDENTYKSDTEAFVSYLKELGWTVKRNEASDENVYYSIGNSQLSINVTADRYEEFENRIRNECVEQILDFVTESMAQNLRGVRTIESRSIAAHTADKSDIDNSGIELQENLPSDIDLLNDV